MTDMTHTCKTCKTDFEGDRRRRYCPACEPPHNRYMRDYMKRPGVMAKHVERERGMRADPERWERWKNRARERHFQLKRDTISAYGGKCVCCGETEVKFLTIDHSNGDGGEHRRKLGVGPGVQFYRKLKKQQFPKGLGLEVQCFNCHMAKDKWGVCPHKS